MPREGKVTFKGTTVPDLIIRLMDKFVEEKQKDFAFIRLSRAKVAELAVLKFLESRGELDKFLTDLGVSDS